MNGKKQIIKGFISEQPKAGEKSFRYTISISEVQSADSMRSCSGMAYLYIINENENTLEYGDEIIFSSALKEIKEPANPGEFDFKKYSFYKGITLQGYVENSPIIFARGKSGNIFKLMAYRIQLKLRKLLDLHLDGQSLNIANALLLGYDDEIGRELMQAYSVTGVLHVLSVSGMHVALVYAVLNVILGMLLKNKRWKIKHFMIGYLDTIPLINHGMA